MNKKSVLIIEDNEAIRDSLAWSLEYENYSILTAENGQEALEILSTNPLPSIILLDVMMPIMCGLKFRETKNLNPRLNQIPTIILTAKVNVGQKIQLSSNEKLIYKPFDLNELIKIIDSFCAPAMSD